VLALEAESQVQTPVPPKKKKRKGAKGEIRWGLNKVTIIHIDLSCPWDNSDWGEQWSRRDCLVGTGQGTGMSQKETGQKDEYG
jgi:hypothetical protein